MVPTDFNTTNNQESIVDVITSFITNAKTPILVQPRQTPLNNPPIYPKPTSVVSPSLSQNRLDTFSVKFLPMWFTVVTSITQHRTWTPKRSTDLSCDCGNTINQRQQLCNVVTVGTCQSHRQRNPIGIGHHMMFRALFAAIRGVWACFRPPKTARTEDESTTAREKSIRSACRNLLSNTWWILSHTPAFCQSRKRRQQVIPDPKPISRGRSSQAIPVLRTKSIPLRAAWSEIGFRPGYRNLRFFFGINGSMICHSSSLSICFAMSSLLALNSSIQLLMLSVINIKNVSFC